MERLQKYISECGIASRRKSEELIKNGKVTVNGKKITEMGFKVSSADNIFVNGKKITPQEKIYIMYLKRVEQFLLTLRVILIIPLKSPLTAHG